MSKEQELKKQLDAAIEELRKKYPPEKLMTLEIQIDPDGMYLKTVVHHDMVDYITGISNLSKNEIFSSLEQVRDAVEEGVTKLNFEIESRPKKTDVKEITKDLRRILERLGGSEDVN